MAASDRSGASGFARVAILGAGLIGGSFAAALRRHRLAGELLAYSPGTDAARAVSLGLVDAAAGGVAQAVDGADLVVLAAPIPALPGLLRESAPHLGPGALLVDCASTKRSVIRAAREVLGPAFPRFVPAHPIAGAERHGPDAARADLFDGCLAVLCPQPDTDPAATQRVRSLWETLGARVVAMDADEHDRVFAEVSHWPHAVAFALCGAIASGGNAQAALRFAGAGLRDTTRIGASSATLWADILLDNRDAVLQCAEAFNRELESVLRALQAGDRDALVAHFGAASGWRSRLRRS